MRILWSSNAPWANTGYGIQAKHILPRLRAMGHDVAVFAFYGLRGAALEAGDLRVYPAYQHPWGVDIVTGHLKHFKADLMISLQDVWVLPENYADLVHEGGAKWAAWFPVDHEPIPPLVLARARSADYALTYSEFGNREARKAGLNCPSIPHGVSDVYLDASIPRPEAREALKLPPEAFIISMVAANKGQPSRKALPENLAAFRRFLDVRPDAILYLHTEETSIRDGIDLKVLIAALGIPRANMRFVDQYQRVLGIPEEHMALIYRASDVLLAASMSEGFGIPILEAQACGTPVITTRFSSMPELTWNGICTEPAQKHWTPMNSWVAVPSVDRVYQALVDVAGWPTRERHEQSSLGRTKARAYAWDTLAEEFWKPFLESIEADIEQKDGGV